MVGNRFLKDFLKIGMTKDNNQKLESKLPWGGFEGLGAYFFPLNSLSFLDKVTYLSRAEVLSPFVLGGNCCAKEIYRMSGPNPQANSIREFFSEAPAAENCDVLVVSGVINELNSPYILEAYSKMLRPRYVIAVGTCSATGAVFDSKPVDKIIPVDIFIGGCPPTIEDLVEGIELLKQRMRRGTGEYQASSLTGAHE